MPISYDDFAKLELRVATVVNTVTDCCADRPVGLDVDLGQRKQRLCTPVPLPDSLAGSQTIVIANLNRSPVAEQPAGAPQPAFPAASVSDEELARVEFRIANVRECTPHPNADKLLVLQIDLGDEQRQICAGLRAHYQPEQLAGRQMVVVGNLEPRRMRGEISQGMMLAATDEASGRVIFLTPMHPVPAGSRVRTADGFFLAIHPDGPASPITLAEPVAPGSSVK